jgi:hypothetical protein
MVRANPNLLNKRILTVGMERGTIQVLQEIKDLLGRKIISPPPISRLRL